MVDDAHARGLAKLKLELKLEFDAERMNLEQHMKQDLAQIKEDVQRQIDEMQTQLTQLKQLNVDNMNDHRCVTPETPVIAEKKVEVEVSSNKLHAPTVIVAQKSVESIHKNTGHLLCEERVRGRQQRLDIHRFGLCVVADQLCVVAD